MSVLRPTDVPVRDPVAQVVALPGDRLLVRHRAGLSLLAGVRRDEVLALLDRVDGRRTAAEVAPDARSAALLRGLAGEAVHLRGAGAVPPGEPAAGRETPEARLPLPEPDPTPGDGRRVVFLEETPYRRLLESLDRLGDGLRDRPTLFVTPDPDGVRVVRACLGCALLAALAPAGLPARESLAVAARLRTVRLADLAPADPVRRGEFLRRLREVIAREAAAEGDGEGVVLVAPDGTERLLPTPRRDDCPVCGGAARDTGSSGAAVKEHPLHPLHIGIVGGGTAGFLTALALRAKRPDVRVTLIRSPDIPVIGVGEATTPLMPQFLHADLRIGAAELFREVRPTFKLGIRFDWGRGSFPYPFGPLRTLEAATWSDDLDACSPQAVLMAVGALPVTREEDGRLAAGFGTETAYHLDNRRLAALLERLARLRGVEVVDARIVGVERTAVDDLPEVVSLVGEGGRRFIFDLYVDCSGFRSLLVGDALGSRFVDYGASLFTDRAVVGTVARAPGAPMPPFTRARTLAAGWAWTIPQPEADHVGSVYSSAFAGADGAARELEEALGAPVDGLRELRFRAGRREHFWRGNAVALGNAYGFVEPLESTSLHLLIRQIGLLVRHLPPGPPGLLGPTGAPGPAMDDTRERLNREVGAFWDYVRWFLAIHFRFNRRLDTPFWRACREEADVSAHGELIERFRDGGPLAYREDRAFDYADPLWGPEGVDTLLLGQGVPCRMPEPPGSEAAWRAEVEGWRRHAGRCLSQAELLASLPEHPEVLANLEAAFRDRGSAF